MDTAKHKCSMHQHHVAAEKMFLDFCGPTIPVFNTDTGEVCQAHTDPVSLATCTLLNMAFRSEASPVLSSSKSLHTRKRRSVNINEHPESLFCSMSSVSQTI